MGGICRVDDVLRSLAGRLANPWEEILRMSASLANLANQPQGGTSSFQLSESPFVLLWSKEATRTHFERFASCILTELAGEGNMSILRRGTEGNP